MVLPYLSAFLSHEDSLMPLKAVTVGPSAHPDLARQAVERMLALKGYYDVDVSTSSVTLRTL